MVLFSLISPRDIFTIDGGKGKGPPLWGGMPPYIMVPRSRSRPAVSVWPAAGEDLTGSHGSIHTPGAGTGNALRPMKYPARDHGPGFGRVRAPHGHGHNMRMTAGPAPYIAISAGCFLCQMLRKVKAYARARVRVQKRAAFAAPPFWVITVFCFSFFGSFLPGGRVQKRTDTVL